MDIEVSEVSNVKTCFESSSLGPKFTEIGTEEEPKNRKFSKHFGFGLESRASRGAWHNLVDMGTGLRHRYLHDFSDWFQIYCI